MMQGAQRYNGGLLKGAARHDKGSTKCVMKLVS